jgi:predicted metal-dependent phosphoesterase TrpH
LAYFIQDRIAPGYSTSDTIRAIHEQGGLAVAAHPYDWMVRSCGRAGLLRRAAGSSPEWQFDAIESLNASLRPRAANTQAAAAAKVLRLPVIGGSDSHCVTTIGYGYTAFAGATAEDLRTAIVQQRTIAAGRHWSWGDMAEAGARLLTRSLNPWAVRA